MFVYQRVSSRWIPKPCCVGGISPMSRRKVCSLSDDIVVYYCCCLILLVTSVNHAICTYMDCSPPARWGLLDFIRAVLLLLLLLLLLLHLRILLRHLLRLLLAVQIPVGTAGPPPRAPDPSGHCQTSTASSRSQWALPDLNYDFQVAVGRTPTATSRLQWALPDLNCDFQIAVGTAGPQPRVPDRSGHCRTSTATSRSQWALPDLNGKNVRKDVR